ALGTITVSPAWVMPASAAALARSFGLNARPAQSRQLVPASLSSQKLPLGYGTMLVMVQFGQVNCFPSLPSGAETRLLQMGHLKVLAIGCSRSALALLGRGGRLILYRLVGDGNRLGRRRDQAR